MGAAADRAGPLDVMHAPVQAGKLGRAPPDGGGNIPEAVRALAATAGLGVRALTALRLLCSGKVRVTWPGVQVLAAVGLWVPDSFSPALLTVTTGRQQLGLELRRQDLGYAGFGSRERLLTLTLVTYCITGKNRSTIYRGAG